MTRTVSFATVDAPRRVLNLTTILPLFQSAASVSLVPGRTVHQAVRLASAKTIGKRAELKPSHHGRTRPTVVKRLDNETLAVPKVVGSLSRVQRAVDLEPAGVAQAELPLGMPRFVNVATLKRMLKAERSDTLLRKTVDGWEICEDALKVDLLDDSVEFRLGAIQIFS